MKRYEFNLVIKEGNDEFWEEIEKDGTTGCEEVTALIKQCLAEQGFYPGEQECELHLMSFTNEKQ